MYGFNPILTLQFYGYVITVMLQNYYDFVTLNVGNMSVSSDFKTNIQINIRFTSAASGINRLEIGGDLQILIGCILYAH